LEPVEVPRVVYDSQVFAEQEHGGVSRYFLALSERLPQVSEWTPVLALGVHLTTASLPTTTKVFGPRLRVPPVPHTFRMKRLANSVLMRVRRPRDDGNTVYHPTWYHSQTIRAWAHLPIALTIHDLIPESWPGVTTPDQLADRRMALERARVVICVSQTTMDKLADHYPRAAERAVVARLGVSSLPTPSAVPTSNPYFVHVGKRGAYKDFVTIIRSLLQVSSDISLVALGGGGPTARETDWLDTAGLRDRVRFEAAVSDQRLANLLGGSRGLISASRDEGFGLPPLEALAMGKPVILSDIPVYRELYSKWASFFPPGDAEGLANSITETLAAPAMVPGRPELEATFSWAETARVTAEAYDRALS
jgi:glycosyltransferase involved in cell wall biosynthesis